MKQGETNREGERETQYERTCTQVKKGEIRNFLSSPYVLRDRNKILSNS